MSPGSNVPRVLIVAGEASGDLYGGLLMRAMREGSSAESSAVAHTAAIAPVGEPPVLGIEFAGIGGASMRAAGLQPVADASALGVTGLFEVAGRFASIWKAYRACGRMLASREARPDLAILIDYPDFNLRLAKRARRAGVPVLYFISPQVWAWRKGRLKSMPGLVDKMLVILPFEEALYREAGVPVEFIGHPLLDLVRPDRTPRQTRALLGLDAQAPVVALLPGSRRNELLAHVPPMIEAARILKAEFRDLQFLMTIAPTFNRREVGNGADSRADHSLRPAAGAGGEAIATMRSRRPSVAAIVASGTATLDDRAPRGSDGRHLSD